MTKRVLLVHNRYQWLGGEDVAHHLDRALLERHGHEIIDYVRDNAEIEQLGPVGRAGVALRSVWSPRSRNEVAELVDRTRPDVAYFINTFPLVTPSALAACQTAGVPVVMGVHSYRVGCPANFFFRDGDVCEDCIHRAVKWPGVVHGCYRESRVETGVVAGMLTAQRAMRVWTRLVDQYFAVSAFSRDKLIESGLPSDRIVVRPNYTHPDPGSRAEPPATGDFAIFVGRLSPEKGINVLVDAFTDLRDVNLLIVGDGPERESVEQTVADRALDHVQLLGLRPHEEVLDLLRRARLLVFPALSYEHCPFVVVEAFACGTPVVASNRGALPEMVDGNAAGALFEPGHPSALARAVRRAWSDDDLLATWSTNARRAFEDVHSAEKAYERLIDVFRLATARSSSSRHRPGAT